MALAVPCRIHCGIVTFVDTVDRRLMPPGLSRPAAVVALLCALTTVILGMRYRGDPAGGWLDQGVHAAIDSAFPGRHWLLQVMLTPSEPVVVGIVIGIIALVAMFRRRPNVVVLVVTGPVAAVTLGSVILKPVFGRTYQGHLAFPSGHTASLVSVLTVLTLLVAAATRPPWRVRLTSLAIMGSLTLTGIVATALVGLKAHYVTDTVGGFCCGVATVLVAALTIDRIGLWRRTESPP